MHMVNYLKNSQNKIVASLNSSRKAIKVQNKKYMSFERKIDLLSTQLLEVLNENRELRENVGYLDVERFPNIEFLGNLAQEIVYSEFLYG